MDLWAACLTGTLRFALRSYLHPAVCICVVFHLCFPAYCIDNFVLFRVGICVWTRRPRCQGWTRWNPQLSIGARAEQGNLFRVLAHEHCINEYLLTVSEIGARICAQHEIRGRQGTQDDRSCHYLCHTRRASWAMLTTHNIKNDEYISAMHGFSHVEALLSRKLPWYMVMCYMPVIHDDAPSWWKLY